MMLPMPLRTDIRALVVLGGAVALAVAADGLLRALPWGLGASLWFAALAIALAALATLDGRARAVWAPATALAAAGVGFLWRDSTVLKALDLLVALTALTAFALRTRVARAWVAEISEWAAAALMLVAHASAGFALLFFGDLPWRALGSGRWARISVSATRGFLVAVPVLLVLGGLLVAADAAYARLVERLLFIRIDTFIEHGVVIGVMTWLLGGVLRGLPREEAGVSLDAGRPAALSWGVIETVIVLGLVDLLFLSFVAVQIRYFFGGAGLVETTIGLTYADYARRGFFELVAVAALVLPLLLTGHWLLRRDARPVEAVFRALAAVQVALLFVIMASAVQRMRLYQDEFGLTELRLYTTAFMVWLGVVFLWFAATVLTGRRNRFAAGAIAAGVVAVVALQILNPDRLITDINVDRAAEGRRFDPVYAASLSADAIPTLVDGLSRLRPADRCTVAGRLVRRRSDLGRDGWRQWSWSRATARDALDQSRQSVAAAVC